MPPRGAADRGRVPVRRLEQHVGALRRDLGARAAHRAGERDDAAVVGDDHVVRVEGALDVVQRGQLLARLRPADHQVALDRLGGERVQRVAQLEHHVVGDVDGQGDGPDAGQHQPPPHPPRRGRGRVQAGDPAQHEPRTAFRVLDTDRPGVALGRRDLQQRRIAEGHVQRVRQLAREAADRQRVAAVRGRGQLDHGVVEAEQLGRVVTRARGARGQHEDAGVVLAEAELAGRADHAVADAAVGLAGRDGEAAGQDRARQRDDDQVALGEVARAADDAAGPDAVRALVLELAVFVVLVFVVAGGFGGLLGLFADVDAAEPDRLLELGQLFDVGHPADDQRAGHRAELASGRRPRCRSGRTRRPGPAA